MVDKYCNGVWGSLKIPNKWCIASHPYRSMHSGIGQPSIVHGNYIFQHNHGLLLVQHLPSLICVKPSNAYLQTHTHQHPFVRYLSLSLSLFLSHTHTHTLWPILFVSRLLSAFFSSYTYRFPLIALCLSPTLQIAKLQLIIWNKSFVVFFPRSERDTWLKAYTN